MIFFVQNNTFVAMKKIFFVFFLFISNLGNTQKLEFDFLASTLDEEILKDYQYIKPHFLGDQVALKDDGGVVVDDFMSTTIEGVWAIGDIRNTPFKQAVVAASDGCIAAMAIDRYLNSRKSIRVDWVHA